MAWYWYYLIVGSYVAIVSYAASIIYKIKHADYERVDNVLNWKMTYGFIFHILFWWFLIFIFCYSSMSGVHAKQKLRKISKEKIQNVFAPEEAE